MAFASLAANLNAQVTTASMSGKVSDANGQPAPGAVLKATHTPTGTVYTTVTRNDGSYNINNMRIGGPYTVEVELLGSNKEAYDNVYLQLGQDLVLNPALSQDTKTLDVVTVTGTQDAVISASRTGAQEIFTSNEISKLPTINRSLSDFTQLTPMASKNGGFGGISYRFNNVTVDGASFSNSFGLSSQLGASGIEPISLDALEQIQVMIAPYDVRNGGFTGAGINSVTKSGDNTWHASAYMYAKSPSMMGYRMKDEIIDVADFSNHQYGVSVSGPIVKNKLFFYLNGEIDRQETPITWTTESPGSAVNASRLKDLSNFLKEELGYNPGEFDVTKRKTEAYRATARLDWNINQNNALSVKYYFLKSYNTNNPSTSGAPSQGRGPNVNAIPFSSTFYRLNNNFNIVMLDLNSKINDRMSNYFKVGYSAIRDFRDMDGGFFPQVDILNGSYDVTGKYSGGDKSYTAFGTETNSYNNMLNSDIFQIQNNFVMNFGKHEVLVGTQSDYRHFMNGFAQNYPGSWVFNSVEDFKFNVLATKDYLAANGGNIAGFNIANFDPTAYGFSANVTGVANSGSTGYTSYLQKYAMGNEFPMAYVDVFNLGLYAQDKWTINDKFNLTFGVRFDVPFFVTHLQKNDAVAAETYRDGIKVDVAKYPSPQPVISPRIGFNYNPLKNQALQIRGGSGIFAGTPPYVWLSNQAGNNGVLFGDINVRDSIGKLGLGFTGDINTYKPAEGAATRSDIAVTESDFKYPNIWKSDIAVDYNLDGWIFTVEGLFSKDINAIYHDNIGLVRTDKFVNDGSGQNARPFYSGKYYSDEPGNKKAANNVVLLRNTNKGYSIFGSVQIQKTFDEGVLKGWYINGSYAFGRAKAATDGSSSVATSAWKYRPSLDPNTPDLAYAASSVDGRLLLSTSYTYDWSKYGSINFGLIYQMYSPFRYTYTYNGDMNGDMQSANDVMYIPKNFEEVKDHLSINGDVDLVQSTSKKTVYVENNFDTKEEAWAAMDAFIKQDPYLSKNRGKFAERNGAKAPLVHQLDLSIYHDFKFYFGGKRSHTLRVSFAIANVLNLLNKNWGVQYTTVYGYAASPQYNFLTVTEKPNEANDYNVKYKMATNLDKGTFKENYGNDSRWQLQFGIKYIF
jgi:hypothetical protein